MKCVVEAIYIAPLLVYNSITRQTLYSTHAISIQSLSSIPMTRHFVATTSLLRNAYSCYLACKVDVILAFGEISMRSEAILYVLVLGHR